MTPIYRMTRTFHLVIWLAAILLIVGALYVFGHAFLGTQPESIIQYQDAKEITEAKLTDTKAAMDLFQEVQNDPAKSSNEKAMAVIAIAGVQYIASGGDISARLQDIEHLKKVYRDETVTPSIRAAALSILGKQYIFSGRNPAIFAEVYKDAPFNSYLVPNNPDLSTINVEKASYDLYPSTVAASTVAITAAAYDFPNATSAVAPQRIALAEEYLNKSDAAMVIDAQGNPTYTDSDRYITYRYERAYTVGYLAITKGDPYKNSYKLEFDELIAFVQTKKRLLPHDLELNVRFQYARVLHADKETVAEKAQLDEIAKILNTISNPDVYSFVQSLQNHRTYRPKGTTWTAVQSMYTVSPDFKAVVAKVLSASSQ